MIIILRNNNRIIKFNVRGKKFLTTAKTLLSLKDTLFHKLILSNKFDLNDEIFFNRSSKMFGIILDCLRYKKISFSRFNFDELEELKTEAEFYEILPIYQYINNLNKVEFVAIVFDPFISGRKILGEKSLSNLSNKNLSTGICNEVPGSIIMEFNEVVEFEAIEIGGYRGDIDAYNANNEKLSALVLTSLDRNRFDLVGDISVEFSSKIVKIKLKKSTAKFIEFRHDSFIGIGYLRIIKLF